MRAISLIVHLFFLICFTAGVAFLLRDFLPSNSQLLWYTTPLLLSVCVSLYFVIRAQRVVAKAEAFTKSMEDTQDRYLHLYRSSPVPYINVNAQGVVLMANLAALRIFKAKDKSLVGQSLLDRLSHENELKLSLIKDRITAGESFTDLEVMITTNNNDQRWVLLSCFSYGKFAERFISAVDISHQKQVDAAKTEFVTLASHQLRTPISTVKWAVDLLEHSHTDKTVQQELYYEKINVNVGRLMRLVDDFLQVSKLELGTFAVETVEVNLTEVLKFTLEEYEDQIRGKRLEVVTNIPEDAAIFSTDQQLLHMVLSNLISNAIKYSPESSSLRISYAFDLSHLTITVADEGMGIPEDEQAQLFKKFFRANNVRKGKVPGTGLGLYIIKKAVEILGGNITFKSTEGKGTIFVVTLPINF